FFAFLQQGGIMTSFWLPFFFLLVYIASVIVEVILSVFKKFALLLSVNFIYTIGFCLLHYLYLQGNFSLGHLFFYILALLAGRFAIYGFSAWTNVFSQQRIAIQMPMAQVRSLWLHLGIYDTS